MYIFLCEIITHRFNNHVTHLFLERKIIFPQLSSHTWKLDSNIILGQVIIRSYYFGKCRVKFGIGLMYWVVDFGSWIHQSKQFKVLKPSQVVHCIFDVATRNSYCQVFCNAGTFSRPKWQIVENASWKMDWSDTYFPSMRDLCLYF